MLEKGALKIYWSQIIVGFSLFYKLSSLQSNFPLYWQLSIHPSMCLHEHRMYMSCMCTEAEEASGGLSYHSPPWNLDPASPSNAPVSLPLQW